MKIKNNGSISLKGPLSRNRALTALKPGEKILAKVLKSTGKNSVLLNLKGNIVNAVFSNGIPGDKNIILELNSIVSDKLFFKISTNDDTQGEIIKILKYTVFNDLGDIKNLSLHSLLKMNYFSLFSFNEILLNLSNDKIEKEKILEKILNKMLKNGISSDKIFFFSLLFAKNSSLYLLISQLYYFLSKEKSSKKNEELNSGIVENLIGDIDESIVEDDFLNELNREELLFLNDALINKDEMRDFVIVPGGDGFEIIYILKNQGNFIFSLNLSCLGNVEVLIRNNLISFYMDDEDKINSLASRVEILYEKINNFENKKYFIEFKKKNNLYKKMIEIIENNQINKKLDFKV